MVDHLFVYGTLRSGSTHDVARLLRREAEHLGRAHADGVVYDFGSYPGAIFESAAFGRVIGEVFALPADAASLLALLDDYEGLADQHEQGQYRRVCIEVAIAGGRRLTAWSYALANEPRLARRIEGGDWLCFAKRVRARKA